MVPRIFLSVLFLFAKGTEIFANRCEYLSQPTLTTTSYIQPMTPYVIQASSVKPACEERRVENQNYNSCPYYAPATNKGGSDNDPDFRNLLYYFLLFALTKNCGGSLPEGFCGNSGNQMSCSNNGYGDACGGGYNSGGRCDSQRGCTCSGCRCGSENSYCGDCCSCGRCGCSRDRERCGYCGHDGCGDNYCCEGSRCSSCGNRGSCGSSSICSACGKCRVCGSYCGESNCSKGCDNIFGNGIVYVPCPVNVQQSKCHKECGSKCGCNEQHTCQECKDANEINVIIKSDC